MVLYRAIRKYGLEAFSCSVLQECDSASLNEAEMYWIQRLGTYRHGYNMTLGGDGMLGYRHTEDTKRRMGEARKGEKNHNFGVAWGKLEWTEEERKKLAEHRIGEKNPMFGVNHSKEAREKISRSQYKPVVQLDQDFNEVATYSSMQEAALANNTRHQGISACCRGVRNFAGGYRWRYATNKK